LWLAKSEWDLIVDAFTATPSFDIRLVRGLNMLSPLTIAGSAMYRASLSAILAIVIMPSAVWSEDASSTKGAFVCTTEQETGFSFDDKKKTWKPDVFAVGEKWLIQPPLHGPHPLYSDGAAYAIYRFGVPTPVLESICKNDFNEAGYLDCSYELQTFTMNRLNHRFIKTDTNGYVNRNLDLVPGFFINDGNGRPSIAIGACVKWDGPIFN
jgi:hypothetical protein